MTVLLDWLAVSVPRTNGLALRDDLSDVCLSVPDAQTDPLGVRVGKFALLRFQDRGKVTVATISGSMCAALRVARLLDQYLAAVATYPHRVTHIHAARDVEADAPSELARIYACTRTAGVSLTRKRIPGRAIKWVKSSDADGRDTGSVMIGHRARHETTACIYDRHQDALDKGKPDPGHLLRYELRTGVDGLSLADAADPAPLFFNFMGAFFPRPDGVKLWVPYGEGFTIKRDDIPVSMRLRRQVDFSADLDRMFRLVDEMPGEGLDVLLRLIRGKYATHRRTLDFDAARNAPCDSEPQASIRGHTDA